MHLSMIVQVANKLRRGSGARRTDAARCRSRSRPSPRRDRPRPILQFRRTDQSLAASSPGLLDQEPRLIFPLLFFPPTLHVGVLGNIRVDNRGGRRRLMGELPIRAKVGTERTRTLMESF